MADEDQYSPRGSLAKTSNWMNFYSAHSPFPFKDNVATGEEKKGGNLSVNEISLRFGADRRKAEKRGRWFIPLSETGVNVLKCWDERFRFWKKGRSLDEFFERNSKIRPRMVYLSHWYGNKKTKVQSFGLSIFTEKIKDVFFTVLPGEKEERFRCWNCIMLVLNIRRDFRLFFFFVGLERENSRGD